MKVVNFFAGPGSGKSTTSAHLFAIMKHADFKVELVREYAKDREYAKLPMDNQVDMLSEQDSRQRILLGKVDYAITDSPLLLGQVYATGIYNEPWFHGSCHELFNSYDNINVFVRRVKPYRRYGRSQTEGEAIALDQRIFQLVDFHLVVDGDPHAAWKVLQYIRDMESVA